MIGFVVLQLCALPGYVCFNGGIEHSVEVYRIGGAIVPPTAYTAIATNFGIGNDLYFRTNKLLCFAAIGHGLLAQKETRVDLQRTVAFRIRKAIEAYSSRRGYFRADVIPGEYGLIIAELNLLVFTIGRLVELIEATRKWHDQYVAILGAAAGTAYVYLGKARYRRRFGKPAAVGPGAAVRAGLNHAERIRRPDKDTPQSFRADHGIDIVVVLLRSCTCRKEKA